MAKPKYDPNELVTRKMLDEFVEAILGGIDGLINTLRRELREEMRSGFKKVDGRLNKLDVGQAHLKDQMDGLKADLSTTATKKDVDYLEERIEVLEGETP